MMLEPQPISSLFKTQSQKPQPPELKQFKSKISNLVNGFLKKL